MKKVLSVVLSLLMVATTFAMLVPTASAASAEPVTLPSYTVYYEDFDGDASNGGKEFDTSMTNQALVNVLFGESNVCKWESDTDLARIDNDGLYLFSGGTVKSGSASGNNNTFVLDRSIDLTRGAEMIAELTFKQTVVSGSDGSQNTTSNGRFFAFCGGNLDTSFAGSANNRFFSSLYNNGSVRVGFRGTAFTNGTAGQWNGCDMPSGTNTATDTKVRARTVVSPETGVDLWVATWDSAKQAYGAEKLIATMKNNKNANYNIAAADIATYFEKGISIQMQNFVEVKLHSLTVNSIGAQNATNKVNVVNYDFKSMSSTKTNAALIEELFGAGALTDYGSSTASLSAAGLTWTSNPTNGGDATALLYRRASANEKVEVTMTFKNTSPNADPSLVGFCGSQIPFNGIWYDWMAAWALNAGGSRVASRSTLKTTSASWNIKYSNPITKDQTYTARIVVSADKGLQAWIDDTNCITSVDPTLLGLVKSDLDVCLFLRSKASIVIETLKVDKYVADEVAAENVLFEEDFNDASYAGKTGAALVEEIFGAGNYDIGSDPANIAIENGALRLNSVKEADAEGKNAARSNTTFTLSTDASVSEGYVAEVDYIFHTRNELYDHPFTFTNKTSGNDKARLYAGLMSPTNNYDTATGEWSAKGNGYARLGFRDAANATWNQKGFSSVEVGVPESKYRMRATVTPDAISLEVAKYNGETLGAYQYVGSYTSDAMKAANYLFTDIVALYIVGGSDVTIDNLKVTSLNANGAAKFVGHQMSTDGTSTLRLLGTIDYKTYKAASTVGYNVQIGSKQAEVDCQYVYRTFDGNVATTHSADGHVYYALNIKGVPAGTYNVSVVPYYVVNGTKVYGEATIFTLTVQ